MYLFIFNDPIPKYEWKFGSIFQNNMSKESQFLFKTSLLWEIMEVSISSMYSFLQNIDKQTIVITKNI